MADDRIGRDMYFALATLHLRGLGQYPRKLLAWLNQHGHQALHHCPRCKVSQFRHRRDCEFGDVLAMLRTLDLDDTATIMSLLRPESTEPAAIRKHIHRPRSTKA